MIAITGATGYLGGALCEALARRGSPIRRLTRHPDAARGDAFFALDQPVRAESLAGVTTLIHAAHDFRPRGEMPLRRMNREGTLRLLDAAREARVTRVLFFSSIASYEGSQSAYGRLKHAIEQDVAALGGTSLRPGLVFGRPRGGLFASLDRVVRAVPVLPDLGNRAGLYAVHVGDLTRVVETWLERTDHANAAAGAAPAVVPVAHPTRQTLRNVLESIAEAAGRRPRFVSVPSGLALAGLRTVEGAGLSLPFRSDSLVSMLNVNPAPNLAIEVFGVRLRPLDSHTLEE
jgi:nucleoside-diphosphate-sugar epimerase